MKKESINKRKQDAIFLSELKKNPVFQRLVYEPLEHSREKRLNELKVEKGMLEMYRLQGMLMAYNDILSLFSRAEKEANG